MFRKMLLGVLAAVVLVPGAFSQTREQKVRDDKKKIEGQGFWLYNDLAAGKEQAKKTNKPMIVVLRCIPCEECVKLDDELVSQDARVRALLDQFVRVRVVGTNGLDLTLFQFDYDQSFAVFFLNANGTIYGRFGTRSHRTHWTDDVSVEGLGKAMEGVLALHQGYPGNRAELTGKTGPKPFFPTPEQFPLHKGKFSSTIDYQGNNVVKSCIHCHQIGDAIRQTYRDRGQPIPPKSLYPHTHPKSLGLILDPRERATVAKLVEGTPAAKAGFVAEDKITHLDGQALVSLADIQWVLHQVPMAGKTVVANIMRNGKPVILKMELVDGWKKLDDTSWRVSSWAMRRMATGGLVLEALGAEDKAGIKIPENQMALRVKHVGQYGDHAAALRAGFKKDDILVSFDGNSDLTREQDLMEYAINKKKVNDKVAVEIVRNGKKMTLTLPMQK